MKYNIFPLPLLSSLAHPIPFHPLPAPPPPIPPPPHLHYSGRCESCSELQGPGGVLQDEGEISGDSAEPCCVCHQRTVHVYTMPQLLCPPNPNIRSCTHTLTHAYCVVHTPTHTYTHPHTPKHTYTHLHTPTPTNTNMHHTLTGL